MPKQPLHPFLTVVFLCLSGQPVHIHAEQDWQLKRDRDGIQIYTRSIDGSKYKAVRAEAFVDAALHELVGLVMDTPACPEWVATCKDSKVVEKVSETEFYAYTLNDLPWPVRDRDVVARVTWTKGDNGGVTMSANLVEGMVSEKRRTVRLTYGVTSWTFVPQPDGGTRVVSEAHLDPGGAVPAWLTNMLLIDSPFDTMIGMRERVATGLYKDTEFAFLTNP